MLCSGFVKRLATGTHSISFKRKLAIQSTIRNNYRMAGGKSKGQQFSLKTPKGTKDWADKDMILRSAIFDTITKVFKRHGGVTIDTPVFELKEILSGKYGEDSKLIYDLQDQGGELCSLRYDLTVPFARYLAMNPTIQNIKRYHIAKVYRRDQPAMTKGRMREFYQCDFDFAGTTDPMVADAEILYLGNEVLSALGIKNFTIKVNHRKILDGIFQVCGVPLEDTRKISSAVDKLDKSPWEVVRHEMTVDKGLPGDVADQIGEYVKLNGRRDLLEKLEKDEKLTANESAAAGIRDMAILFDYLDAYGITEKVSFDMSLARGLDYYTGIIYECVTTGSAPPPSAQVLSKTNGKKKPTDMDEDASEYVGIGSIAAGGRYDELVGMFASGKKNSQVPCVGISFGVERLFSLIKTNMDFSKVRSTDTEVYIMAFGGGKEWTGFLPQRMRVAKMLWDHDIKTEFQYKNKVKPRAQFDAADKIGCPLAVILGQDEFAKGIVKVKELGKGESGDDGVDVALDQLVTYVKSKLSGYASAMTLLEQGLENL